MYKKGGEKQRSKDNHPGRGSKTDDDRGKSEGHRGRLKRRVTRGRARGKVGRGVDELGLSPLASSGGFLRIRS